MRVAILDNGAGNLYNLVRYFERVYGVSPKITMEPRELIDTDLLVLPGVGNFAVLSSIIDRVRDPIYRYIESGGPLLAICLGMQALFTESEEGGGRGLGVFDGRVVRIRSSGVRVPHIGWDPVEIVGGASSSALGMIDGRYFYYAHSYYVVPSNRSIVAGVTRYGDIDIPAVIYRDNIVATQFHPERSGVSGRIFARAIAEIFDLGVAPHV